MSSSEAPRRTRGAIGVYRGAIDGARKIAWAASAPYRCCRELRLPRAASPGHRGAGGLAYHGRVISNLDELFAPLGAGRFFAEHYEKRPLHLAGSGTLPRALLTHEGLLRAIEGAARGGRGAVPEGLVLFAEQTGTTAAELVADEAAMRAYLEAGHPLVWNRARGMSPAVDALAALLAEAFGARVWPNVYATGTAGTPFDVHFDAHEVIAIQCEGEKGWWLSEVRVDRPLDAPEMEAAIEAALRLRRDEAAARTLCEWTARPGDLVYIPRGQFHNARAAGGRSLHVTFGIRPPSGFELAQVIVRELLADPLLRELLPPRAGDPDGAKTSALLAEVAGRARAAFGREEVLAAADEARARWRGPGAA